MDLSHINAALVDIRRDLVVESPCLVGEGGAGRIYRVDTPVGPLALKVAFDDARCHESRCRIAREARILGRLDSHLVPRLEAADPEGRFLLRGFVDGVPLDRVPAPHASDHIQAVLQSAAAILPGVHAHRSALRDFKPANLVVDPARGVCVVDVGSCRAWSAFHTAGDPVRIGSGRWRHWAPEQLIGFDESPSGAIDYFSVASTVTWCATGEFPYTNQERATDRARLRYVEEWRWKMPRIRERLHEIGVPRAVAEFVVRSLDPRPGYRATEIPAW